MLQAYKVIDSTYPLDHLSQMSSADLRFITGLLLFGIATTGCSLFGASDTDRTPYDYVALDSTGATVVEGTLFLNIESRGADGQKKITGSWKTKKVMGSHQVGPQVGKGKLEGTIRRDGELSIDMNPEKEGVFWTKVFLNSEQPGELHDLRGRWSIMRRTGTGPTVGRVKGRFEAKRR